MVCRLRPRSPGGRGGVRYRKALDAEDEFFNACRQLVNPTSQPERRGNPAVTGRCA
jgi:hypothetical protein